MTQLDRLDTGFPRPLPKPGPDHWVKKVAAVDGALGKLDTSLQTRDIVNAFEGQKKLYLQRQESAQRVVDEADSHDPLKFIIKRVTPLKEFAIEPGDRVALGSFINNIGSTSDSLQYRWDHLKRDRQDIKRNFKWRAEDLLEDKKTGKITEERYQELMKGWKVNDIDSVPDTELLYKMYVAEYRAGRMIRPEDLLFLHEARWHLHWEMQTRLRIRATELREMEKFDQVEEGDYLKRDNLFSPT